MSADRAKERRAAAYALVALPDMTAARLSALLHMWPDPVEAVAAVAAGAAGDALSTLDTPSHLPRHWAHALDVDGARRTLERRRTHVLVRGDPDFPFEPWLPQCPGVLLLEGEGTMALDAPRVGVVGTRAATEHGLADARDLGAALADAGVTVVSGLAIGIDGAAHSGALDAGGHAVGVVATGLDITYPRRHELLYARVRESGLLISEVAYGTRPDRGRFPVRNRIVAALSDVVVVVEATVEGGARITAERALDYARPVFALPGSRRNPAAAGCNALLADGALPLLEPDDVIVALGMTAGSRRTWRRPPRPTVAASREAVAILRALGGEPATVDQLASRTGWSPPTVSSAVAELSRSGAVTTSRGMVWPA